MKAQSWQFFFSKILLSFQLSLLTEIFLHTDWFLRHCMTICCVCVCMLVTQSYLTLCGPMDRNPPGSSVQGILQTRILEWVIIPFPRGPPHPRVQIWVSSTAQRFFIVWPPWKPILLHSNLSFFPWHLSTMTIHVMDIAQCFISFFVTC